MNFIANAIDEHIRKGDVVISFGAIGGLLFGKLDGFNFPHLFDITILSVGVGDILSFIMKLASVMIFGGVGALGGAVVKEFYPIVRRLMKQKIKSIKTKLK